MFNRTHGHSPAVGEGSTAPRHGGWRRSRAARMVWLAVPVAALSACLGSSAALADGTQYGRTTAAASVTWHKLSLINGWQSSQSDWNSGDPSYAISGGVVYLSGSLHGGAASSDFAVLPKAARPAHWLYVAVYMFGEGQGTLLIKPDGEMSVYSYPAFSATKFASLAAVSFPTASSIQHKLTLKNGWKSGQSQYGTGDPSYAVRNGIVYLSGSLKGGTRAVFGVLPANARPSHTIYRGVYTLDGAFGEVYIKPSGLMGVRYNGKSKAYTSLAGISFPVPAVTQHPVTLLNGWKSAQTPYGTGGFSYAIKNGVVYLSGGIKQPSGTIGLFAVLPKAARPAHVLYLAVFTAQAVIGSLQISPDGDVFIGSALKHSAARTITSLAAISYPRSS